MYLCIILVLRYSNIRLSVTHACPGEAVGHNTIFGSEHVKKQPHYGGRCTGLSGNRGLCQSSQLTPAVFQSFPLSFELSSSTHHGTNAGADSGGASGQLPPPRNLFRARRVKERATPQEDERAGGSAGGPGGSACERAD